MLKKFAGSIFLVSVVGGSLALFSAGCSGGGDSGTGGKGGTANVGGKGGKGGATGAGGKGGASANGGGGAPAVGGAPGGAPGGSNGGTAAGGANGLGGAVGGSAGGGAAGGSNGGATAGTSGLAGAAGGSNGGATAGTSGAAGSAGSAGGNAAGGSVGGAAGGHGGTASAGGAGGAGGVAAAGGAGGGTCNTLALSGPPISKTSHAGGPPAMNGGVIAAGTYLLTAIDKYNGTTGSNMMRETWVLSGGNQLQVRTEDSAGSPGGGSATYTISGHDLVLSLTCPSIGTRTLQFNFDGVSTLKILSEPTSSDQEVHVLTKQP